VSKGEKESAYGGGTVGSVVAANRDGSDGCQHLKSGLEGIE
jgi:hypothetical protein